MEACQRKRSSPTGPALHDEGGSLCKSTSSFCIRLLAIFPLTLSITNITQFSANPNQFFNKQNTGNGTEGGFYGRKIKNE
jgi:hypothetical protein